MPGNAGYRFGNATPFIEPGRSADEIHHPRKNLCLCVRLRSRPQVYHLARGTEQRPRLADVRSPDRPGRCHVPLRSASSAKMPPCTGRAWKAACWPVIVSYRSLNGTRLGVVLA
jgi:hypothetical protein